MKRLFRDFYLFFSFVNSTQREASVLPQVFRRQRLASIFLYPKRTAFALFPRFSPDPEEAF